MDSTPDIRPPSLSDWNVPSWLTRLAAIGWRVLVTVAFAAVVVAFAMYLSLVSLSILFGVIAVATLGPFKERLLARGWGNAKAAGGALGAAVLIVSGALLLIALALVPFLVEVTQYIHGGLERLNTELASTNLPANVASTLDSVVTQVETWLSQQASAIVNGLVEVGTIVMLGLFLTFYFLLDGDKAWDLGLAGLGEWPRDRIRDAGEEAMRRAGGYVRGTAAIAAVDSVVSFVVLSVIGVSLAGPLAVLVLAAGFIPYIGGLFVAGILLLAGFAAGGVSTALLLLLVVIVLKIIEKRRLGRFLSDRTLQLHPAVILLALLRRIHDGRPRRHVRRGADGRRHHGHRRGRARRPRAKGNRSGVGQGRHPGLARPSRPMELAIARRGWPDRPGARDPLPVPGRRRPDRGRGHARRDIPSGRPDTREARVEPGPRVIRGQHRRLGDGGGGDVAAPSRHSARPSGNRSRRA